MTEILITPQTVERIRPKGMFFSVYEEGVLISKDLSQELANQVGVSFRMNGQVTIYADKNGFKLNANSRHRFAVNSRSLVHVLVEKCNLSIGLRYYVESAGDGFAVVGTQKMSRHVKKRL